MKYVQGKKECWKAERSDTKLVNVLLGNTIITFRVIFSTRKNSLASLLYKTLISVSIFYKERSNFIYSAPNQKVNIKSMLPFLKPCCSIWKLSVICGHWALVMWLICKFTNVKYTPEFQDLPYKKRIEMVSYFLKYQIHIEVIVVWIYWVK